MPKLSVVIIARNEEHNILRCLESVKPIADEIVVVDSMSTDQTASICKEFGCKVYQREFDGYGMQKQFAVDKASNDWVFSIDADEVVSDELKTELIEMFETPCNKAPGLQGDNLTQSFNNSVTPSSNHSMSIFAGYNIPFSLHFMGRLLRHGGVGNEFHLRLFNRTKGGFTQVPVHEGIEVNGSSGTLQGRIIHFSYRNISHHLEKINTYTSQASEGYQKRGQSFPKIWVALKFPITFISVYIIKLGFLDGYPGFMWSFLAAVYSTLKVAKTIELTRKS
ncbi:MAG: glycosyltransferase family 2 protein [Bacteroidota bacterium]